MTKGKTETTNLVDQYPAISKDLEREFYQWLETPTHTKNRTR